MRIGNSLSTTVINSIESASSTFIMWCYFALEVNRYHNYKYLFNGIFWMQVGQQIELSSVQLIQVRNYWLYFTINKWKPWPEFHRQTIEHQIENGLKVSNHNHNDLFGGHNLFRWLQNIVIGALMHSLPSCTFLSAQTVLSLPIH